MEKVIGTIIGSILGFLLNTLIFWWAWNNVMPLVFHLPVLAYTQAMWFIVMGNCLTSMSAAARDKNKE